jgi:diadenosine tetraphosphate (Ap4A) HIT family hydrolase
MQKMKPAKSNCDFCDEFASGVSNAFYGLYRETLRSRVLIATDSFRVFPSIGQLVEGYLLTAPLNHYAAMAEAPTPLIAELAHLNKHVRTKLSLAYGPCISYEHGVRREGAGGCGIYHAHLHTVPLAAASDPIRVLKLRFPYTEFAHLGEISKESAGLSSYLFYQDSDERLFLFDTGPLPSQYMRKVLADTLGEPDWNWRDAGREERLLATIRRLSGQFQSTQDSLTSATHDAPQ